ncbi:hypothetical protein MLD38_028528 [Melastoma candidum]|uniref:Uncharacterized protein n=1 Tax=Melastoma candidum TaxID=119954 RepID=A0ACB9N2M2_9MYRT|nr:hypothetical protein MLD38_028528 [Melastoma candidum]
MGSTAPSKRKPRGCLWRCFCCCFSPCFSSSGEKPSGNSPPTLPLPPPPPPPSKQESRGCCRRCCCCCCSKCCGGQSSAGQQPQGQPSPQVVYVYVAEKPVRDDQDRCCCCNPCCSKTFFNICRILNCILTANYN